MVRLQRIVGANVAWRARGLRRLTGCDWVGGGAQEAPPAQLLAWIERWVRRTRWVKTMHVEGPLQGDEGAFDAGQQSEAGKERERQPDHQLNPGGRREPALERQRAAHDKMRDDEDGKIGRGIVRAMVVERLAAGGTMIAHLEVSAKELPCSATGAAQ